MENPFKLNFDKQNEKKYKKCTACHYLMAETLTVCPNCNFDQNAEEPKPSENKTISFSQFKYAQQAGFKLMPHSGDGQLISFDGDSANLNRENVGPGDMSISGETHAKITCEDGNWYIENMSSNEATFIRVQGKVQIPDGAVLIFGQSKVFTFMDNKE